MAYVGVVDGFVPAVVLVRFEVAAPEFNEAWAQRGEFTDQSLQPLIGGVSSCGQSQVGDQSGLLVGPLVGGLYAAGCLGRSGGARCC